MEQFFKGQLDFLFFIHGLSSLWVGGVCMMLPQRSQEGRIWIWFVVVGGLAFSQVVTLFVTPGLFLYMQAFQEKVLDRFELTRSGSSRKER